MLAASNWLIGAFNWLIMSVVVKPILWVMRLCFYIFRIIAELNFFNESIYSDLTSRIYQIIAVVMLFVFAYQIILLIINPDGGNKGLSNLVKDSIISFILILVLPTIFSYMSIFQKHVIDDNTIPKIILNYGGENETSEEVGQQMSIMVITSLFYPTGTDYSTFYDSGSNEIKDDAVATCIEQVVPYADGNRNDAEEICSDYAEGLKGKEKVGGDIIEAMPLFSLVSYDGHGFSCHSILLAIVGVFMSWLFLSYSLDLATRAIKLAVLEILAPVPVIMRILPKSKDTFNKWYKELLKTYLEVFVRLAFIFLIVYMCRLVPIFVSSIINESDTAKPLVIIAVIVGLTKFAKDAPELMKKIFGGGELFAGVDLKGGVKRRLGENEYLMKGLNAATQGVGGAVAGSMLSANRYKQENNNQLGVKGIAKSALGGVGGAVSGTRSGWKNQNRTFGVRALLNQTKDAAQAAEDGQVRLQDLKHRAGMVVENGDSEFTLGKRLDTALFDGMFQQVKLDMDSVVKDDSSNLSQKNLEQLKKLTKPMIDYLSEHSDVKKLEKERDDAIAGIMTQDYRVFKDEDYQKAFSQTLANEMNTIYERFKRDPANVNIPDDQLKRMAQMEAHGETVKKIHKEDYYEINTAKRDEDIKATRELYKDRIEDVQKRLINEDDTYKQYQEKTLQTLKNYSSRYGSVLKAGPDQALLQQTINTVSGASSDNDNAYTSIEALKKAMKQREKSLKTQSAIDSISFGSLMGGDGPKPGGDGPKGDGK